VPRHHDTKVSGGCGGQCPALPKMLSGKLATVQFSSVQFKVDLRCGHEVVSTMKRRRNASTTDNRQQTTRTQGILHAERAVAEAG
jgi:hypothetical protein